MHQRFDYQEVGHLLIGHPGKSALESALLSLDTIPAIKAEQDASPGPVNHEGSLLRR